MSISSSGLSLLGGAGRMAPGLILTALLSACGGGGSIPDTVQISLGTTPPASDPSNPPAGDPSTPPAGGGSDTTKPTITIETPTASSTFSAATASLALGGKASDNVGVTQVTWSNSQGGSGSTTPASGNWSIGNITLKANTSNVITVTARDAAGNAQTDTIAVSYTVSDPPPVPPPGTSNGLSMPTLQDERDTYANWKWTWNASQEPTDLVEPVSNYYVSPGYVDVHSDTEADDLWNYVMMYRRTGNPLYQDRAQAWLRYFKQDYRAAVTGQGEADYGMDHLYGWGLVAWYEHTCAQGACDSAALAAAEGLAEELEKYWSTLKNNAWPVVGQYSMSEYGPRQGARHLLLATRVAEATGNQRWITLRDRLIDLWLKSPDWDANLGMYFNGEWSTDTIMNSEGAYKGGARITAAHQLGVLSEAFDHAYRTTGRTELRDRMVAMARFVDQYGLDPTYKYNAGWFGVVNGQPWHRGYTVFDSAYTTSLVNALVRGYKYTGDRKYYDKARFFFNCGTKGKYETTTPCQATNTVHHFVDTIFESSYESFYLHYNKGELQYTYLLFEKGGLPLAGTP